MRFLTRTAVLAGGTALAAVVAVAAPAAADDSANAQVAYAVFHGPLDADRKGGVASGCNEVITSGPGSGTFLCDLSFDLNRSICDIDTGQKAGSATYTSHGIGFTTTVPMFGYGAEGSGVVRGAIIDTGTLAVVHVTIDASSACDNLPTLDGFEFLTDLAGRTAAQFEGKVTYN